jgi:hypothetical protein
MGDLNTYSCFGFEFLGACKYDPQSPTTAYFTIGDAVAALAFALAIQQFLKPIYLFRLRAMRLRFSFLVWAVFIGAMFTFVAAAVPNVALLRGSILGYPIIWETAGGLVIAATYALVATISLRPAFVTKRNIRAFSSAGFELLSEATDEDRVAFSKDLFSGKNIARLSECAAEFDRANRHAVVIEFEKLREEGREGEAVHGQPPVSAFYEFSRREELDLAGYAWHFLQLLSDRDFCRIVVTRNSWGFLRATKILVENCRYSKAVENFIQSVAWQALLQDEGMLARESRYGGSGWSKSFANEFFGNSQMHAFGLLEGVYAADSVLHTQGFVSRLNVVAELMVTAEIKARGFWDHRATSSVVRAYEQVCHSVARERSENKYPNYFFELRQGIADLTKLTEALLEEAEPRVYNMLFATDLTAYRRGAVDRIAALVCDALKCVANDFNDASDPAWSFALDIMDGIFHRFDDRPNGLSPLQQAVAIKLMREVNHNMDGYYPTLSRVLLAAIGPYEPDAADKLGSAAAILKDALYFEMKRFPELYEKNRKKAMERLPPSISYHHPTRTITHTFFGGTRVKTKLNDKRFNSVNLLDQSKWRLRS